MVKLVHREILLFALESGGYGVDPTPTGTDAMLVENLAWAPEGARMVERPVVRVSKGKLRHLYAGSLVNITFDKEVKGSGTAGTAPEIGALLRVCGLDETIVGGTSVTYAPVSASHESGTAYLYEDGDRYIVTGCRGTVSIAMEAGGRIMASFTLTGHYAGPSAQSLPTPTYEDTVPPIFIGASIEIGAEDAPVVQAMGFDLGNNVIMPADANASDGYGEIRIIGRDVTGTINPEAFISTTKDFIDEWRTGVEQAITTGTIGADAGNIVEFTAPACALREVGPGDRDGIRTSELTFGCGEDSGDDELAIVFT